MADNGRIYKEAYRTCRREYDTLIKKYEPVRSGSSWLHPLKWMLPVLAGAALLYVLLYFIAPGRRMTLTPAFICIEVGLAIGFAAYLAFLYFGRSGQKEQLRVNRLNSILEQLDEAWVANDLNESTMRAVNAERELRKTQRYSVAGIRERVLNGINSDETEGGSGK